MGPKLSKDLRTQSDLEKDNNIINKDKKDISNENVDKSKIDLINNDITSVEKKLTETSSSKNSSFVINSYTKVNKNLNDLKTLYSDKINQIAPDVPDTSIQSPSTSIKPTTNIPNTLPANKINYTNKNMISSTDTSKLYNTVEGFTEYISSHYNNMPIIEGLSDTDTNNITALMKKEKELLDQLADFNTKYIRYIHCNDPKTRSDCVSGNEPTSQELKTKMTNISNIINAMNSARAPISQTTNYQSVHDDILSDYEKVLKLRYELDMKVKQLYNPENSKIADFKYSYDSTIYSGIIISALATSMLYFVFTEL